MKTARLFNTGDLRILEENEPEVKPGEVLIEVKSVGVCGSDLHWLNEGGIGDDKLDRPLILGMNFPGSSFPALTRDSGSQLTHPSPAANATTVWKGTPISAAT